jgi:uncharacterized protein (DUF58 family)
MIVPRTRLLFWFALVVLPFATLGALYAEGLLVAVVLIAVMVGLAVLDAALASGVLEGIQLQLPEVVRLSKDRWGLIELKIANARQKGRRLRLGLAFPREIQSRTEDQRVSLPPDAQWSRLEWACQPAKRGTYFLRHAYLEGTSPLGFWAVRGRVPVHSELRVYPNLLTERKNLAALFLHRGNLGMHAQRLVGKGRDFEKLREYVPGDSLDEIHWKATAKRGHPVTKVFQIERTQEVYVIVDASRLSARAVGARPSSVVSCQLSVGRSVAPESKGETRREDSTLERFITAALILGLVAEQQGDLYGLLTFTDKVDRFVRAKNGQAHYSACRDALYTLEPKEVTPDFDEVCTFIRLRLRRRALLVLLTALDDPVLAESFVRHVDLLSRQHLVLVNMLKPPNANPLFQNAAVNSRDDLYEELGGHIQWHNLRELQKVLQRRGVRFSLVENEKWSAQLVSQYLGVKQRQLL